MVYGSGQFWNKWQRPAERFIDKIPEWDEKRVSFESEITKSLPGNGNYFIDFSAAPKNFKLQYFMSTPLSLRENDYYMQIEPQEWDGCIYLQIASPATPI
uniref:Uncharacterized protein n=2 Tax=Clytia hemisphaerica TaxID=252671 RepID=A0A7M5X334_9CNID